MTKKFAEQTVPGEDDDEVTCERTETLEDGSVRSTLVLKLAGAPSGGLEATTQRLLTHQAPYVKAMLSNFESCILNPEL